MLPSSHFLLGCALAEKTPALSRHPVRKGGFLLGNILPDLVPHTFFVGSRAPRVTGGHCLPFSESKIEHRIKRGLTTGLYSTFDAFRLGLLMHYLADSFTYPHTTKERMKHKLHQAYEKELKKVLPAFLALVKQAKPAASKAFLSECRKQYNAVPPSPARDAEWIVRVCAAVFSAISSV